MRDNKIFSFLSAAAFAFCISFGGIACIVTGFGMEDVQLLWLGVLCVAFSLAAAGCFSFSRGWAGLAAVCAIALFALLAFGDLYNSLGALAFRITHRLDSGYRWGYLQWVEEDPWSYGVDTGLFAVSMIPAVVVSWTVCRRKPAVWAVAAGLLPLCCCLVLIDTVPAVWCLFLLIAALVLLIITNTVRRRSAMDGNRLTAMLLIPSLLTVWLLFGAVPREGYQASPGQLQEAFISWAQDFFGIFGSGGSTGVVNLKNIGPQIQSRSPVMEVTAAQDGTMYLRGQSLDTYTGLSWDASGVADGIDWGWPTEGTSVGTVYISTRLSHQQLYLPYYAVPGEFWNSGFTDGKVENPDKILRYNFEQIIPGTEHSGTVLSSYMRQQCVKLPADVKGVAWDYLIKNGIQLLGNYTNSQKAQIIKEHVQNVAPYSLNAPRMPKDETDFAMWFLENGESGYCVHFATAAVVLLRTVGIPARYVTGYMFQGKAGDAVTVTADRAHAWAEYYDPERGWCVLDATPGTGSSDPQPTTPTQGITTRPTESTEPTTAPTRPTQQTQTTAPSTETTPIGGADDPDDQQVDLNPLWNILRALLWAVCGCGVLFGQYAIRRRLRRKKALSGASNARALALWREILRRSRVLKQEPPEELLELAEKAKFSQHTLTAQERMALTAHLDSLNTELAKKPVLWRLLIRLIFAV